MTYLSWRVQPQRLGMHFAEFQYRDLLINNSIYSVTTRLNDRNKESTHDLKTTIYIFIRNIR